MKRQPLTPEQEKALEEMLLYGRSEERGEEWHITLSLNSFCILNYILADGEKENWSGCIIDAKRANSNNVLFE